MLLLFSFFTTLNRNALIPLQARRAAADAAAGAAETIARVRLEAAASISESADRLVTVISSVVTRCVHLLVLQLSLIGCEVTLRF